MISIDESRCNLCGLCVPVCVRRILKLESKSVEVTDPALCLVCGHCKAVCPTDAPQLPGMNEQFQTAPPKEGDPRGRGSLPFLPPPAKSEGLSPRSRGKREIEDADRSRPVCPHGLESPGL